MIDILVHDTNINTEKQYNRYTSTGHKHKHRETI
jgi:hypothetical protein